MEQAHVQELHVGRQSQCWQPSTMPLIHHDEFTRIKIHAHSRSSTPWRFNVLIVHLCGHSELSDLLDISCLR